VVLGGRRDFRTQERLGDSVGEFVCEVGEEAGEEGEEGRGGEVSMCGKGVQLPV